MILRHGAGWRDTHGPGSMEIVTEGILIALLPMHADAFPAVPGGVDFCFRLQDASMELAAKTTAVRPRNAGIARLLPEGFRNAPGLSPL
jgi:hypothetical protein